MVTCFRVFFSFFFHYVFIYFCTGVQVHYSGTNSTHDTETDIPTLGQQINAGYIEFLLCAVCSIISIMSAGVGHHFDPLSVSNIVMVL